MLHDIAVSKYRYKKTNGTIIERNPALGGGGNRGGRKERESENKQMVNQSKTGSVLRTFSTVRRTSC